VIEGSRVLVVGRIGNPLEQMGCLRTPENVVGIRVVVEVEAEGAGGARNWDKSHTVVYEVLVGQASVVVEFADLPKFDG
jgi:hypothetical protein